LYFYVPELLLIRKDPDKRGAIMGMKVKTTNAFMRRILTGFIFIVASFALSGQAIQKRGSAGPDLGLHGKVTWLSDTKIRVEYDWSDDSQLLDWTPTYGSSLIKGKNTIKIENGRVSVRSMIWKQLIKCSRIYVKDAKAVNSPIAHLNFITNVSGWTGNSFDPVEIIGLLYASFGGSWLENGTNPTLPAPIIALGDIYTVDINISDSEISAMSSSDGISYTHSLSSAPDFDRQVAIGGWGGDTEWGKIILEGELTGSFQTTSDVMDVLSCGAIFSPSIEIAGNPIVEWTFNDGSTSLSTSPSKDYGSQDIRHNFLKVTPWSALIGINLGYDASDGGYGGFTSVANQNILAIKNLSLAKNNLQYLCASYSPIAELDLRGFSALKFAELYFCHNLASLKLDNNPLLERLCIEECNVDSLNLSGCPALKDIRGAQNRFTSINWGSSGAAFVHICVRSNPQFVVNLPDLTQFPVLKELLIWDDSQTGPFICHNSVIEDIEAYDNHYTSADINGCTALKQLLMSGNHLESLNLGTADVLKEIDLKDCFLPESIVDYVLSTIIDAEEFSGTLELTGNAPPSSVGIVNRESLISRGWTVNITDPNQSIAVSEITVRGEGDLDIINTDKGTLQLIAEILPGYASDKTIAWSLINGTGQATINSEGVVTAISNGIVTARATARDGSGTYGELVINISNQAIPESELIIPIVTVNEIKLYLDDNYISWKAQLFNLQGSLVYSVPVDSDIIVFNSSSLSPGLYLIVLSNGDRIRIGKVVIP
jgi:hypothetical protein